ncbi:MAG: hypothetical protein A2X31_13290 [Elusimicrobia bacterium GWB2_63_22]|nr:MAG: hypothetical protein A2X31_13290 [Elusimicrobia bacterium GWB2_63_22]
MKKERNSLKYAALFAWHWLCSGFFLGTLTLMGPVRRITDHARAAGWSETGEKAAVFALIGVLFFVSLLCARLLADKTAAAGKAGRYGLPAGALALALLALWFWLTPSLMIDRGMKSDAVIVSGTEFVFGPYPGEERLSGLKEEGYTAVISLLSPAVVPFEPVLLASEIEEAQEAGLPLIHLPMLPWISSNDHVEKALSELLAKGSGKYYVHCYLGKDRVNVFRRMLAGLSGDGAQAAPPPGSARTLYDIKSFERGAITVLAKDVFLMPYPTDEEFFGYVLNGSVASLVSLLDPANPENLSWIKKEKEIAAKYRLPLASYPWRSMDTAARKKAVEEIKRLKKPTAIHAFLSASPDYAEFKNAYRD